MTDGGESEQKKKKRTQVFPPALVPILRRRLGETDTCCRTTDDATLSDLLTVIFFAGFETEEGEHYPIRVVFVGDDPSDWVAPDTTAASSGPIYRWSALRFDEPRPFTVPELVKLAVATASDRMYTRVRYEKGALSIDGLMREGFNYEGDPFVKVMVEKPGTLSLRTGHDRLIDYERGVVLATEEDRVLSVGAVRAALEGFAHNEGLTGEAARDYIDMVRAIVREMAAHGHGGILVIGLQEDLGLGELTGYRIGPDVSLALLVRQLHGYGPRSRGPGFRAAISLGEVLRGALLAETERIVEELGAISAIDGATVLDQALALLGFGLVLPVMQPGSDIDIRDAQDGVSASFDLGTRGARHRAAATYASTHPGAVVFVASQDGDLACLYRDPEWEHVAVWRFGSFQ